MPIEEPFTTTKLRGAPIPTAELEPAYKTQGKMTRSELVDAIDAHYATIRLNRPDVFHPKETYSIGLTRTLYRQVIQPIPEKLANLYHQLQQKYV